jgi:hypothetical protein
MAPGKRMQAPTETAATPSQEKEKKTNRILRIFSEFGRPRPKLQKEKETAHRDNKSADKSTVETKRETPEADPATPPKPEFPEKEETKTPPPKVGSPEKLKSRPVLSATEEFTTSVANLRNLVLEIAKKNPEMIIKTIEIEDCTYDNMDASVQEIGSAIDNVMDAIKMKECNSQYKEIARRWFNASHSFLKAGLNAAHVSM